MLGDLQAAAARASVSLDVLLWDDQLQFALSVGPEGVRRSLKFRGWLWDDDPRIDGRPGTLEIYIDDNRAREWKSQHDAYGTFLLMKGAERDEGDSFRALVYVDHELGETIEHTISSFHTRSQMTLIELQAALHGSPNNRPNKFRFYPEDLDLSEWRDGHILGFELSHWRPVGNPHLARGGNVSCMISITKCDWWGYFPFGSENVSLSGIITTSSVAEMVDRSCRINWSEDNWKIFQNDYRSAGQFSLRYGSLDLTLYPRYPDANRRVSLLLQCERPTLDIELAIDGSQLQAKLASVTSGEVAGVISRCSIHGERRFDQALPSPTRRERDPD